MDLEIPGYPYNRLNNPTVDVLEQRVTALEGGAAAMAVSSGAAAVSMSVLNLVGAGDNFVSVPQLYGATYTLLAHIFPKQGIEGRFSKTDRPEDVEPLIDENTRAVFCESVGNPAGNVADIEGLARVAHKHGVPLIVDNTVATPVLLRPIEYGADVIVHSMTKFMGGHGTTLGGMIVDSGKFPWRQYPDKFYMLNKPEVAYHGVVYVDRFGDAAFVARCRTVCQRNTGSTLAPRALATRGAWARAKSGLMCGSSPEPEPVTASAGIGAFAVNTSGALSLLKALISLTSSRAPLASLNWSSGTDDS